MKWDANLDTTCHRIASATNSPLRVIAGPGTGKTFTMMRRVARILQDGIEPERILVCTFTRTAAHDLKKELGSLGVNGSNQVRAGTIHSLCYAILSKSEILEIMGRVPRTLLDFEERIMIDDLRGEELGNYYERESRLEAFKAAWSRLQSEEPGWPNNDTDKIFQKELLGWLQFHEGILIGELIPETLRYLKNNPLCDELKAFDHILVDEYQDLNRAEQSFLDLLSTSSSLTVIGDEDQSIYSFKYAHPEGISEFASTHSGTQDESLEECRRCPNLVVDLANQLIKNNQNRTARMLKPHSNNANGNVHIVQWHTLDGEIQGIARYVHGQVTQQKFDAGRILILSPRRQIGYAIRDELNRLGTSAHSFFQEELLYGNSKILERCNSQQTFTLLTLLANPKDRVALRTWCAFGSPSYRSNAWGRVREYCENNGGSPNEILEKLANNEIKIPNTGELVQKFKELACKIAPLQGLKGKALFDALFPESDEWTKPFRQAIPANENSDWGANELKELLQNKITQPELPTDVPYVRIMSLHKSKGLTADLVVVVGCIEGLIPRREDEGLPQTEKAKMLEEQRRLFYVAITRSKDTLILSSVTRIPTDIAHKMRVRVTGNKAGMSLTAASRFLQEFGPNAPQPQSGDGFLKSMTKSKD